MTVFDPLWGGSPVGYLTELDDVEAGAVHYLRLWCGGPESQAKARDDFTGVLGAAHGRTALNSLDQICELCDLHGRRPLVRHPEGCGFPGPDEACFARFVATAAEGEREDAMLIATLIIRADMSPILVELAESLGLALKRMVLRKRRLN